MLVQASLPNNKNYLIFLNLELKDSYSGIRAKGQTSQYRSFIIDLPLEVEQGLKSVRFDLVNVLGLEEDSCPEVTCNIQYKLASAAQI